MPICLKKKAQVFCEIKYLIIYYINCTNILILNFFYIKYIKGKKECNHPCKECEDDPNVCTVCLG